MDFESSFVDLRLFQENQPFGISWHRFYIASRLCIYQNRKRKQACHFRYRS